MIRVAHIITGLGIGGAEMMLYKLLSRMDRNAFDAIVVSLSGEGAVGDLIHGIGIPIIAMEMRGTLRDGLAELKLTRVIRSYAPDVVQTWMYHANLLGGLAAKVARPVPIIWGLHHGNLRFEGYRRSTPAVARTSALLSPILPEIIVCCSESSKKSHVELGYAEARMTVIPNGFDPLVFKPDREARLWQRKQLGITDETPVVGLVGRFHPQKDHWNFVQAAALLHRQIREAHFVLAGPGISWGNQVLANWIEGAGLRHNFHLLHPPQDIPKLTATFDIATLSSITEAFPNVVGEAMSCGVPCVVTDVGDAVAMIGETGVVVPVSNPQALAEGWRGMLETGRENRLYLGKLARQRIVEQYSLAGTVASYENLYKRLVSHA